MSNQYLKPRSITSEAEISELIQNDPWRMDVLRAAEKLDLPDWWIGAGFLRNIVWDAIEGVESSPTRDVDLVYFDSKNIDPKADWEYDEKMQQEFPFAEWEIRNQARMHYVNNFEPFTSTADGIAHWVETATCVGVKLRENTLQYVFCHGTEDLFGLIARPTEPFTHPELFPDFEKRITEKHWQEKWPNLQVIYK